MAEAKRPGGFSDAEKTAMRERAREVRHGSRGGNRAEADAAAVQAKIAEMADADRARCGPRRTS